MPKLGKLQREFSKRCRVGADERLHRIDGRESRQTAAERGSDQPASSEFVSGRLPWVMKQGSRAEMEEASCHLVAPRGRKGLKSSSLSDSMISTKTSLTSQWQMSETCEQARNWREQERALTTRKSKSVEENSGRQGASRSVCASTYHTSECPPLPSGTMLVAQQPEALTNPLYSSTTGVVNCST